MKKLGLITLLVIVCSSISFAQIPTFIPISGLRAWYPFSGNANDSSGYTRHGIPYGSYTYGTDRFGNEGRCFDGSGESAIDLPNHFFPLGDSARSVSVFFKYDSAYPGEIRHLFGWGNNFYRGRFGIIAFDTMIGLEFVNGYVQIPYTPDTTMWHNLIVTYPTSGGGSAGIKIYYDGNIATTHYDYNPTTFFNTDSGEWHNIAGSTYYGSGYNDSWKGRIDDIGVWDRELSACEAWRIANSRLTLGIHPILGATNVCIGDTLYLTDSTSGGIWSVSNNNASINDSGVIIGNAPGLDTIMYAVSYPCGFDTVYHVVNVLSDSACTAGITAYQSRQEPKAYPNPTKTFVTINDLTKGDKVSCLDLTGRSVGEEIIADADGQKQYNLQNLQAGFYLLVVTDKQGNIISRIRVEKQ